MINTTTYTIPAYTTRDFRSFGLYQKDSVYKFKFTPEDRALLNSGAIKLIPLEMCECRTHNDVVLNGKKFNAKDIVNPQEYDDKTLMVLFKSGVIECSLKEEYNNKDNKAIAREAKIYDCYGKTFKETAEYLGIDFKVLKDKFELKQGGSNKKVSKKDIKTLLTIEV